MNSNSNHVLTTISWTRPGQEVFITGNWPDLTTIKMQNVYSSGMKKKTVVLWLPPGTYYYKYIVDKTEQIDPDKPIDKHKGTWHNVITVQPHSRNETKTNHNEIENPCDIIPIKTEKTPSQQQRNKKIIISDNFTNSSLNLNNSKGLFRPWSLLEGDNSFSIKGENEIHDLENSLLFDSRFNQGSTPNENENENGAGNWITNSFEKVLVYNIGDSFLIPMFLLNTLNTDLIRLKYFANGQELTVNKNDWFLQKTFSFGKCGNLSDWVIINELSILYSIQQNFKDGYFYIFINDIYISFVDYEQRSPHKEYFEDQWINSTTSNFYLVKKSGNIDANQVFHNIIFNKSKNLYYNYSGIFEQLFTVVECWNTRRWLLHFIVDYRTVKVNVIPFFSSNGISNEFHSKSILFVNEDSVKGKYNQINPGADREIRAVVSKITHGNILWAVQNWCNFNANIINKIWTIFVIMDITTLFKDFFKQILLSFLIYNQKKYYSPDTNNGINIGNLIPSNLRFYSNLLVINLIKYLLDIISVQLQNLSQTKKAKDLKSGSTTSLYSLLYIFDSWSNEDNELLNELILKKCSDNKLSKNKGSIASLLTETFALNMSSFDSSLSINDKIIISYYESILKTDVISKFYNKPQKKLKDILVSNIYTSYQILETHEMNAQIKQWWYTGVKTVDDAFFSNDEAIIEFLQSNKIQEYANYYHGKYFSEFTFRQFFEMFSLVWTDIDSRFNPKTNYTDKVNIFLTDWHSYQGISEAFVVNDIGVKIGYQTFEILTQLIKCMKDEKAKTIQKNYRMLSVNLTVKNLRKKVGTIQAMWRWMIYNKSINSHQNDLSSFVWDKYKRKDPVLWKLLFDIQKRSEELIRDNIKLHNEIEAVSKKGHTNKNVPAYTASSTSFVQNPSGKYCNGQWKCFSSRSNITNNQLLNTTSNNTNNSKEITNPNYTKLQNPITERDLLLTEGNWAFMSSSNRDNKSEIEILKEKLNNSRKKYQDLISAASEYEKKMDGLMHLMSSKDEICTVWKKYGIAFN